MASGSTGNCYLCGIELGKTAMKNHLLKEHGLNVDADATTVEEARDSILAALAQANSPLLNKGGAEK